jgi:lipopolysaccharide transport system ATP-binding protein
MGIIGRNGAGKSTLLKILSRITKPTKGHAQINGRVASLLEVGTGFHPELTGRENMYLNAAILGMRKTEVRSKFDEIVAFAEIEKFLDMPVKRYSSGMYVRLAFAVAAHLEPEILIVDEVLAVGDAQFQKKCLGKMGSVAAEGRTVLFVSHNIAAVSQLCSRVALLAHGELIADGRPGPILSKYLQDGRPPSLSWMPTRKGGRAFYYNSVCVTWEAPDLDQDSIPADAAIKIVFDYVVYDSLPPGRIGFYLTNKEGAVLLGSANTDEQASLNQSWTRGRHLAECRIDGHFLAPGRYHITIGEPSDNTYVMHENVISFDVSELNSLGLRDGRLGMVMPLLKWSSVPVDIPDESQKAYLEVS